MVTVSVVFMIVIPRGRLVLEGDANNETPIWAGFALILMGIIGFLVRRIRPWRREYMNPLREFISNIIKIELAYINTNHPHFYGGGSVFDQMQFQPLPQPPVCLCGEPLKCIVFAQGGCCFCSDPSGTCLSACLFVFFFEFRSRLKGVNIIVVNPEASKLAGVWASRLQDRGDPKVFIRIAKHFWDIWSKMIQIIWAGPEMLSV